MKSKLVFIIFITFIIKGCGYRTLPISQSENLKGKTIVLVDVDERKWPNVITQGQALVGAFGGLIINTSRPSLSTIDSNRSDNFPKVTPSVYIGDKIIIKLKEKYKMLDLKNSKIKKDAYSESLEEVEELSDLEKYNKNYKSDYILEIETFWKVYYSKRSWGKYGMKMQNNLRLINRKNQEVRAKITCRYDMKRKIFPTYEEMFDNNGALMKMESLKAMDLCTERVIKHLLN